MPPDAEIRRTIARIGGLSRAAEDGTARTQAARDARDANRRAEALSKNPQLSGKALEKAVAKLRERDMERMRLARLQKRETAQEAT